MIRHLINLIYPEFCLVCNTGVGGGCLCRDCTDKIRMVNPAVNKIIYKKDGVFYSHVYSMGLYEGVLKEIIHLFKYKRKLQLLGVFSMLLIDFVRTNLNMKQFDLIAPVPLHSARLREREFNQAALLARPLAKRFDIALSRGKLRRRRFTPPQSNLKKENRIRNLKDAFRVQGTSFFKGKRILLVDDVFTTGSTVNECAKALLASGAKNISVLTLARGE